MDRRAFIGTAGLASTLPALGHVALSGGGTAVSKPTFDSVNFHADGLNLSPIEYASLLQQTVSSADFSADYYSLNGCVTLIEQTFAKMLGKEAAMFVPTGTLANHIAIRTLAGNDRRVLVQAESHLYNDSGDCAQTLSGLNLIPLATGGSTISLADVQGTIERTAGGRVASPIGVISIENPVRRRGHEMVDFAELQRVCAYAREQGIRLHLDGARMFTLPHHSGKSVRDYAGLFDTVYVSLWKHFNAASGAILAGSAAFIEGLFHTRRMFGGALPYAWPSMAVAARFAESFERDYTKAWVIADELIARLRADGRFSVVKQPLGTCRFTLAIAGTSPETWVARCAARGIALPHANPETGIFTWQVNASLLRTSAESLAAVFIESLDKRG